jgi:plasmid stabilization system protein ParE
MTVIWSAEAQAQLAAIHEHVAQDAPSSIVDAMNTWTW